MPQTHRKLRRKELKQPDEFMTLASRAQDFFTNNLTQVIASAAVVAAAIIVVVGVRAYQAHRDRVAGDAFYEAVTALNQKQYKPAQQAFIKLAADEPGREVGRLSRLYLASCYLAQNDLPRARDALAAYVADAHDPLFEGLALAELATIYERMGDFTKAAGAYSQAVAVGGPGRSRAELGAARMLERAGDRNGAIAAYRQFLLTHPYSAERQDAVQALANLGAAADQNPPVAPK